MRISVICASLVALVASQVASAATVGVDFALLLNADSPVFGDGFDDAALDMPPWVVPPGLNQPGPEAGGQLQMQGNTGIIALVAADPQAKIEAQASVALTDFSGSDSVTLLLLGTEPGDALSLTLLPDAAFMADEASILSFVPITPGNAAVLSVVILPDGTVSGTVNGESVFVGTNAFAPIGGVGLTVVPEPATLALLVGPVALYLRRRRA